MVVFSVLFINWNYIRKNVKFYLLGFVLENFKCNCMFFYFDIC